MMDRLFLEKDNRTLKLAMPVPVKIRDPFLRIKKKMDPTFNLEMGGKVLYK